MENIEKSYKTQMNLINATNEALEAQISLLESTGKVVDMSDYSSILSGLDDNVTLAKELLDDYVENYQKNVQNLNFGDRMDALSTIEELRESWYKAQKEAAEYQYKVWEIANINPLKNLISDLQTAADIIQNKISIKNAKGLSTLAGDYYQLISNSQSQVENLEHQNRLLTEQQSQYEIGSEKFRELQEQIDKNTTSIQNAD